MTGVPMPRDASGAAGATAAAVSVSANAGAAAGAGADRAVAARGGDGARSTDEPRTARARHWILGVYATSTDHGKQGGDCGAQAIAAAETEPAPRDPARAAAALVRRRRGAAAPGLSSRWSPARRCRRNVGVVGDGQPAAAVASVKMVGAPVMPRAQRDHAQRRRRTAASRGARHRVGGRVKHDVAGWVRPARRRSASPAPAVSRLEHEGSASAPAHRGSDARRRSAPALVSIGGASIGATSAGASAPARPSSTCTASKSSRSASRRIRPRSGGRGGTLRRRRHSPLPPVTSRRTGALAGTS